MAASEGRDIAAVGDGIDEEFGAVGDQTAFGLYPLLFIRKLRCSLVVCFGFTNEEYLNALVDFIDSSRGRLERDRGLRSPIPLQHLS